MLETLSLLPLPFWLVLVALVFFGLKAWRLVNTGLGLPMLAVLLTVTTWYVGDVLYNDYSSYLVETDKASLETAWWEVLLFVCVFGLLAPGIHRSFNRRYLGRPSRMVAMVRHGGLNSAKFQNQIDKACWLLALLWLAMMITALIRTDFDFKGLFLPFLGEKDDPWGRGRVGGSALDAVLALASYCQIALAATFGVIAALSCRPRTLVLAILICLLTLPGYIFDRARSYMLATLLPGFLSLVFLRIRANVFVRVAILAVGFFVLEGWFKYVIEYRAAGSIAAIFHAKIDFLDEDPEAGKHYGLNMFEELGYINFFIKDGSYRPNWGERYFAELVNPIPRALWPGKPLIGIDYAIARGLSYDDAGDSDAGVGGTVSTGMIGQGVVNFGGILGPVAAALLMSLWVAILARQDLLGAEPGRLFLYVLGLVLTFNMGRDITLLVLYPFCFGYLLLLVAKTLRPPHPGHVEAVRAAGTARPAPPAVRIRRSLPM
jgi:hypothetical protein